MNWIQSNIFSPLVKFFADRKKRRLSYLVLISLFALGDFFFLGLARRTFVFYSDIGGYPIVEDRMLVKSHDRETEIRRYVDDAVLGPVSPDSALLLPAGTRLESFMLRDDVVYAGFSETALLAVTEGGDLFRGMLTLNEGIRRNFSTVKNVRFFIGGNEVFFEEFRGIFLNPADNDKIMP